jgi:hypothetical protein
MIPPDGAFSARSLRGVKPFRANEPCRARLRADRAFATHFGDGPTDPCRREGYGCVAFVRWATFGRALAAGGPISTGNHLDSSPLSRGPEWILLTRAATGRHFRNRGERALRCSVRGTHACRLGRDRDFEAKLQRPQTLLRAGPAPKH